MLAENNGILVGTMLDSNKEIPLRLKGAVNSKNLTGDGSIFNSAFERGFRILR